MDSLSKSVTRNWLLACVPVLALYLNGLGNSLFSEKGHTDDLREKLANTDKQVSALKSCSSRVEPCDSRYFTASIDSLNIVGDSLSGKLAEESVKEDRYIGRILFYGYFIS